jgi:putative ABC transport system permease protein
MSSLFRRTHLPVWRRAPLDFLLPCFGIAVGVAAILAIDLGSASTVSSFRRTIERIEGRTTHQVKGLTAPLDPALAYDLAAIDGVDAAAPILETFVLLAQESQSDVLRGGGEPLRLIGLDPFAETGIRELGLEEIESVPGQENLFFSLLSEPGALLVSQPFLDRHALGADDSLSLVVGARPEAAFVLGRLPERVGDLTVPDNLALCDLATALELTGREDVSRIDLVLRDESVVAAVRAVLPAGVGIEPPGGRAERLNEMVHALGVNLRALSYLALFVSLFLIYNALLLAVLRRRRSIGLVRCLGATRGEVLGAWLLEGLALGVVGTGLGLLLGLAGGGMALHGVQSTASGLYGAVSQGAMSLEASSFLKAIVVGILAALLATAWPALEAARTIPAHTSARGEVERSSARVRRWTPALALPLLVAVLLALRWPSSSALPGYLAAMCLALAAGVLTPAVADALLGIGLGPLRRLGLLPALAARNLRASMSRTGVALAALAVALSMSVAMGTMVGAFRAEVIGWIGETVAADIYLSPATAQINRSDARLSDALAARLAARPEVEKVDSIRGEEIDADGIATYCAGIQLEIYRVEARPRLLEGPALEEYFDRLHSGEAGITESLYRKIGKHPGETITIRYGEMQAELTVAGVYKDYSSDRGVVLVDRSTFRSLFGPRQPNGLALYLKPSVQADPVVDQLQRDLSSEWSLVIRSNRGLREEALQVFDRTFAVSRVLEGIGIAVAAIGILGALLAMLLERRREIATLRALALTRRQVGALLLSESLILACLAWLLALGLGSALAWILLRVINVRSFGWSLAWSWPLETWLWNLLFGVVAAVLATLYPILRSGRLSVAAGLREE